MTIAFAGQLFLAATGLLLCISGAPAQPAMDCGRAKTPAERAICGNPELASADAAMARAYAALRAGLPPDQQTALLADQRQWVTRRDADCGDKSGDELSRCLLAATEARRRFLAGESPNGAGSPRLVPGFFHDARKGRYEITIAYPRLSDLGAVADAGFDRTVRAIAFGKDVVAEYRELQPGPSGSENFYLVEYEATYLDPRLASVVFAISTYSGGAHPNSARVGLLYNFATHRRLEIADILADPEHAVPAIAAICKARLAADAEKSGWDLFDEADVGAVVREAENWAVRPSSVEILFDPYSVAPYAAGPHECPLSYAELAPWLKPGGPLPPR
jgi:uncharacterized protein YecT (DUF1311 family)